MTQIFWSILGFLIAVSILTAVHELGHFWVARSLGIKILRFSIGFGKPLFSWINKHGTEFVVAAIPLGGYVKMLDGREEKIQDYEQHRAFNNKSVWIRMAVIAAGPAFNLLFAVVLYWLVFINGISSIAPVLGAVPKGSIADLAGLKAGQEILTIEDKKTKTWEQVSVALMPYLGDKGFVQVKAKNIQDINLYNPEDSTEVKDYTLDLSAWNVSNAEGDLLISLGLEPFDPTPPVIGGLVADLPAELEGLQVGDKIIALDDIAFNLRKDVIAYIRNKASQQIKVTVLRNDEEVNIRLTPYKKLTETGEEIGFIGVKFLPIPIPEQYIRINKYNPIEAFIEALAKTKQYSILTLQFIGKLITGKVSVKHVAGPVSIAKYAGQTIASNITYFLSFMALISISFGVLNMLPIPLLDGGQFLFCLIELLKGSPLSVKFEMVARYIGFSVLALLMLLAIFNDIVNF